MFLKDLRRVTRLHRFCIRIWVQTTISCLITPVFEGMRRYQCGIVTREFIDVLLRIIIRNASPPMWNYNRSLLLKVNPGNCCFTKTKMWNFWDPKIFKNRRIWNLSYWNWLREIRFVCLQKTPSLTTTRVHECGRTKSNSTCSEGRGSPLVLKPVQRRQHQCVLRSRYFLNSSCRIPITGERVPLWTRFRALGPGLSTSQKRTHASLFFTFFYLAPGTHHFFFFLVYLAPGSQSSSGLGFFCLGPLCFRFENFRFLVFWSFWSALAALPRSFFASLSTTFTFPSFSGVSFDHCGCVVFRCSSMFKSHIAVPPLSLGHKGHSITLFAKLVL